MTAKKTSAKKTVKKSQKDPEKVRKGKNSVRKGKTFERDLANWVGHIFSEAKRNLEFQADDAMDGTDLEGTDIFQFQCKNHQNYTQIKKIFEIRLKSQNHIPVLVTKGNKLEPMAVLPLTDFIKLLEICYGITPPFISQSERGSSAIAMKAKSLPPFNSQDIAMLPAEMPHRQEVLEHTVDHLGTYEEDPHSFLSMI